MVKKIRIVRTFTLVQELSMTLYPDMTPEQAVEYERSLHLDIKLENLAEEIEFVKPGDFEFTEEVTIVDR